MTHLWKGPLHSLLPTPGLKYLTLSTSSTYPRLSKGPYPMFIFNPLNLKATFPSPPFNSRTQKLPVWTPSSYPTHFLCLFLTFLSLGPESSKKEGKKKKPESSIFSTLCRIEGQNLTHSNALIISESMKGISFYPSILPDAFKATYIFLSLCHISSWLKSYCPLHITPWPVMLHFSGLLRPHFASLELILLTS